MSRPRRSNPKTMYKAGELRRESTPAGRKLWAYLRGDKLNGMNFRRQHAIGNFTSTGSVQASLILSRSNFGIIKWGMILRVWSARLRWR
ncbi:DUF559 domain-containing protein [Candidatus Parcubacteria bacterium]|nr:MAG: DUF559 domain-containing protein [Candidatus Parcubacteria bacterium]